MRLRLLGTAGIALVTVAACRKAEVQQHTEVVRDPYDGGAAFPNRRPTLVAPGQLVGLTSDNGSDTITVLDLGGGKVAGAAPVGRNPVDLDGPHHLAVDAAHGFAFVALAYPAPPIAPGPHAAHGSSQRDGFVQRLALEDLRVLGEVRVDKNPGDIVLAADGSRLVVSHFDLARAASDAGIDSKRASIAVIDAAKVLASGSPDPAMIPTCVAPHGVALSRPDGKTAYVACYGEDALAIVSTTDPAAPVVRVPVGAGAGLPGAPVYGPYSAVLSASGKLVALGDTESKDVRFYDVAAGAMSALVVPTQGAPYFPAFAPDELSLYVPVQSPDGVVHVDTTTGAVTASRTFAAGECKSPHEVDLGPAGALYVVCEGDHASPGSVLILDPETLATVGSFTVGIYPDRLALAKVP